MRAQALRDLQRRGLERVPVPAPQLRTRTQVGAQAYRQPYRSATMHPAVTWHAHISLCSHSSMHQAATHLHERQQVHALVLSLHRYVWARGHVMTVEWAGMRHVMRTWTPHMAGKHVRNKRTVHRAETAAHKQHTYRPTYRLPRKSKLARSPPPEVYGSSLRRKIRWRGSVHSFIFCFKPMLQGGSNSPGTRDVLLAASCCLHSYLY